MSRKESIQKRLQKVRPPRVQLTYDVEKGDAVEQKELPFVAGVLGDFAGQSEVGESKLRDRKFVAIDVDNFDDVMDALAPRAAFRVRNRLSDDGGELAVDLTFRSFEDFRPESVARQVEPLRKLLEARARLAELRNKLAGNEKLDDLLSDVLGNTEKLRSIGAGAATGDSRDEQ
ncbi:hypothetical protein AzCIB_3236 [Azoarcus sp. CIB]|uniref:type VI secretion system contractile sheath small subunit n=1 Tax=Aromatoleum sp. (strain CIB) TaxID=198107 RepID=UPI00067E1061|nr:type VI secretion system contractile sheath small subunit [Azoarcus sp. CIB]AKU13129.1 hypothetical protein AzCIB_3236 [Azoarcus sp. CIB]